MGTTVSSGVEASDCMSVCPPEASETASVVIIGASGFIGDQLLRVLAEQNTIEIRVLVRRSQVKAYTNVEFVEGDLLVPRSLNALFRKNCTVVNLAFLEQGNLQAMTNLANACANSGVRRLIHCSTAVVAGVGGGGNPDESSICSPVSEYQRIKLQGESCILKMAEGKFEAVVLRPTAVFGSGGKNLLKLASQLMTGNMFANYVRSCLFSRRSMNLVCVENVVAAIVFLLNADNVSQEIFLISDDDSPENNYHDVESQLLGVFGRSYWVPRIPIPKFVLRAILYSLGKLSANPAAKFSDRKLAARGFVKPRKLDAAVTDFALEYRISRSACRERL